MAGPGTPGPECSICTHPNKEDLDRLILAGEPTRSIAAQRTGITHTTLRRHKRHLEQSLVHADLRNLPEGGDLLDDAQFLQQQAIEVLEECKKAGAWKVAITAIGVAQRNIELQAKLLGLLQEQQLTNVLLSADWLEVRTAIIGALTAYPEARDEVAKAIAGLAGSQRG